MVRIEGDSGREKKKREREGKASGSRERRGKGKSRASSLCFQIDHQVLNCLSRTKIQARKQAR